MARKLGRTLAIDVESMGWDGHPPEGQPSEIIDDVCSVDVTTIERISKRSLLVKPERSTVSVF